MVLHQQLFTIFKNHVTSVGVLVFVSPRTLQCLSAFVVIIFMVLLLLQVLDYFIISASVLMTEQLHIEIQILINFFKSSFMCNLDIILITLKFCM